MTEITVNSNKKIDAINITGNISNFIPENAQGFIHLYCPHSTAALIISEYEDKLIKDLKSVANRLLEHCGPFEHNDNNNPNASAHILSSIMGVSTWVPVQNGKMKLGKYQNILLLELDGPKQRKIQFSFIKAE